MKTFSVQNVKLLKTILYKIGTDFIRERKKEDKKNTRQTLFVKKKNFKLPSLFTVNGNVFEEKQNV